MGQVLLTLMNKNVFAEIFMISYLSRRGITPYNYELFPGGDIERKDDDATKRFKFRVALYRQNQLDLALRGIQRGDDAVLSRCMSPCMIREINQGHSVTNEDQNGNVSEFTWKNDNRKASATASRISRDGFGTLGRLVSENIKRGSSQLTSLGVSSEEIVTYDVVKDQKLNMEPLRGSQKEKRARSRPEPRLRMAVNAPGQRQSMSVTQVKQGHPLNMSLNENPSYVVVERLAVGGVKKRAVWPIKDVVRSALKDPTTRPTSYFLARFRPGPDADFVEIDYRFNRITNKEAFQITSGSLEQLLNAAALAKYQADIENNNSVDAKETFLMHFPTIFNNLEGRVWWNGFAVGVDGPLENRMVLKAVTFDPPAFIFDMIGLRHISATRNDTRLTFIGDNREDKAVGGDHVTISRTFLLRGRTEQDLKQLDIKHQEGTTFVKLILPMLSSIPVNECQK